MLPLAPQQSSQLLLTGLGLLKLGYVLRLAAQHGLRRGEQRHATA